MDKFQVLYDKIIKFAKFNDYVRTVVLNGSRVNPNIEPDAYQDFDMVFYVDDFSSFIKDKDFINNLGEILVMQTKDDQRLDPSEENQAWYIYLVQFKDGSRLDLTIRDIDDLEKTVHEDSLTKVVLDKDQLIKNIKDPDESSYYIKKPNTKDVLMTVNEFYWVCPYVGKGLARNHVFYALKHLDILRKEIERMIDWWIGFKHDFKISVGKGKYRYVDLLSIDVYNKYTETYSDTQMVNIWKSFYTSIDLFDKLHGVVARFVKCNYQKDYKDEMLKFIEENYKKSERG